MYVMVERRYEIKDTLAFIIDWENEEKHRVIWGQRVETKSSILEYHF